MAVSCAFCIKYITELSTRLVDTRAQAAPAKGPSLSPTFMEKATAPTVLAIVTAITDKITSTVMKIWSMRSFPCFYYRAKYAAAPPRSTRAKNAFSPADILATGWWKRGW